MPTKTPEMRMAAIFQEVGLVKFQSMAKLIIALNTPKREKMASTKTTRAEQEGFIKAAG